MMSRGDQRARGGYRNSRGARGGRNAHVPLKGLFKDAKWHCNCEPRLPAERFKVKKGSSETMYIVERNSEGVEEEFEFLVQGFIGRCLVVGPHVLAR